jgi:hypothetical protein
MAGLIAWRIHRTRSVMPGGSRPLLPVFIVIIETGALYATSVLALLIAFVTGSNGQYMVLDIIVPIVVRLVDKVMIHSQDFYRALYSAS